MSNRTRKLPWPMSRIDRDCLHELWQEKQRTGKHISKIVAEAVITHLNQQFDANRAAQVPSVNLKEPAQSAA